MAKAARLSDTEQVSLDISKLDTSIRPVIEYLRTLILATDKQVAEQIKWNTPCFYYAGAMKPYNPKEYKRDIIVFNLFKNRIMLVFPSGGKLNDTSGLLEGDYKDGRRVIIFTDMADVKTKEKKLQAIIRKRISLVDQ